MRYRVALVLFVIGAVLRIVGDRSDSWFGVRDIGMLLIIFGVVLLVLGVLTRAGYFRLPRRRSRKPPLPGPRHGPL